jgi:hypothetical protein
VSSTAAHSRWATGEMPKIAQWGEKYTNAWEWLKQTPTHWDFLTNSYKKPTKTIKTLVTNWNLKKQ